MYLATSGKWKYFTWLLNIITSDSYIHKILHNVWEGWKAAYTGTGHLAQQEGWDAGAQPARLQQVQLSLQDTAK